MKHTVDIYFEGKTTITVNPDEYPWYFKNDEARGGLLQLAEDLFYDHADLRGTPFNDDATEFFKASIGDPEPVEDAA